MVDDDKDILDVIKYILEDSGYEVDTLSDGHFLFDKINEHIPDLILLDVMLGGLDGRELCKDVKAAEATHNIPVILISATHPISSFTSAGSPNDFISKPFDISVLLNCVQRQLAA